MKWIYLNGTNQADSLALATVLACTTNTFGVVRKSCVTRYLFGLEHVNYGFYPNAENDDLIRIDCSCITNWREKCAYIAQKLSIQINNDIAPYLGFIQKNEAIERIFEKKYALLLIQPHPDQDLDLMIIDKLTKLFAESEVKFISAGTLMMPCIKGTKDCRETIGINELCLIRNKVPFILTSEVEYIAIAEALGIPAFVISSIDGRLTIDDIPMADANQIYNYLQIKLKK